MLCYRCGSHVQDGAEKCWNCSTRLASTSRRGASTTELRARQRTGSRISGVVFKIGDVIAHRYRVSDIIGSGGAGVVYRAHDQEIDVEVALKVINAKLVQTADEQRLFSRQTKIARKLSHQNIVRIFDEGRDEDRPFFTMQLLEGLSLRRIIDLRREKQQTFSLAEIEPIFNQLCQALDYAHKTTFHGDLKPDNIIVLPDLLKVTDFALLRGLPRKPFLAIQKSRASNFRYLAPEVRLEVNELDRQVDLYSLGVILCEMLTGIVYDDAKPEQLAGSEMNLDAALLGIIRRAVARAPKDRYPVAGDVYEDLRTFLAKGAARGGARVPPTTGTPPHLAEAPTQRLDISRHGARPVPTADPAPDVSVPSSAVGLDGARAQPILDAPALARDLDLPSAMHSQISGSFAPIDDDMIEGSVPSAPSVASVEGGLAAAADRAREASEIDPSELDPDGDADTEHYDAGEDASAEAALEALVEISNSAIELIADPRATNRIRLEPSAHTISEGAAVAGAGEEPSVSMGDGDGPQERFESGPAPDSALPPEAPFQHTEQPMPLPDSALPSPAFGQASLDGPTEQGRLDFPRSSEVSSGTISPDVGGGVAATDEALSAGVEQLPPHSMAALPAPRVPELASPGAPSELAATGEGNTIPISRRPATGVELGADEPKAAPPTNGAAKQANGKSPRVRPMTRPRMSAIQAPQRDPVIFSLAGSVSSGDLFDPTPSSELLRQPTGARPLVIDGAGALRPGAIDPAPAHAARRGPARSVVWTMILSTLAVAVAGIVVFKLQADQKVAQIRALQREIAEMRSLTGAAQQKEPAGASEATTLAGADDGKGGETEAARLATVERERAQAEAELRRAQDEGKRLEGESRKTGDRARQAGAEVSRPPSEAPTSVARREAGAEAKRESEERATEEGERKRREKEQQAKALAEQRVAREHEAKQRAEEKAARLLEEKERAAEAARLKREEREARRAAERAEAEERRAEEKRKAEEARAAREAKKRADESRAAEEREKRADESRAVDEKKKPDESSGEAKKKAEEAAPMVAQAASVGGKQCPKGMALVEAGAFMLGAPRNDPERNFGDLTYQSADVAVFCIDYYEFPNGRGLAPAAGVSFKTAQQHCKKKGKRLCTEPEWEKACKGPSGSRFPYGNQWDPAACVTEDDEGNDREVSKSGAYARCRSGYNLFDMSGNVAEWTATEFGTGGYVVKGGAADRPGYDGRCAARKKKKAGDADVSLGFRCCADPS